MKLMSDTEYKRMHPVAAISGLLAAIREFIVPIGLFYLFGRGEEGTNWFLVVAIVIPVLSSIGRWFRFTYWIGPNHLSIKEGLLTQKQVEIPKNRVQSVDISSGLLQRLFGLVSVSIQIAGASESAVTLNAVTKTEADRVLTALKDYSTVPLEVNQPIPSKNVLFKLSNTHLMLAGLTSGRLGVILTLLLTLIGQLEYVYDVEDTLDSIAFLENWFVGSEVELLIIGLLVIVMAWVLSILGTAITYYAFELALEEKNIVISYGLLKRKHISVPVNRIQAARFNEGLLRQYWGYGTLYVESAGRGDQRESSSHVIIPFIHKSDVNPIIEAFIPELSLSSFTPEVKPPRIALRRYLQRAMRPIVFFVPTILILSPDYSWVMLLILFILGLLGWAQFNFSGYRLRENTIVLYTRFISKNSVSLKRNRVQSFEIKTTPLLEKAQLWSFDLHLASVNKNIAFGLSYLNVTDKVGLLNWMLKR